MESTISVDDGRENHNPHFSPNPLKCPPAAAPLLQMSPERMNQQRIPQSPSLHSYLADHDRPRTRDSSTSDVLTKIAFLNGLAGRSTQSSPTRPRRPAATSSETCNSPTKTDVATGSSQAFQRAIMGYEEAQASLATLTAELERSKEELTARKKRERMLSQRVEDLLEELQVEKEKRIRDQESYTKEIKRCRKETYRAELAIVEVRQDLQDTRTELKKSQAEVQHEKSEKEKSRQESFERAYALAGTIGELDQVKDRLNVVEKERDVALAEAKAGLSTPAAMVERSIQTDLVDRTTEDVATNSTSGPEVEESVKAVREAIKTQWSHHTHTKSETRPESSQSTASGCQITSERPPRPRAPRVPDLASVITRLGYFSKQSEGEKLSAEDEVKLLKQELAWAKRKHTEDADLIHLMHMQCQFKACPCRLAEANGERFIHDTVYDAKMQQQRMSKKRKIATEAKEQQLVPQTERETTSCGLPSTESRPDNAVQVQRPAPREPEPADLPPEPVPELMRQSSEEPLVLEQAMEVPLPDADPMQLDPSDSTLEPTAQLEEITQVIVEPAAGSKLFNFSTSISSRTDLTTAPPLRHAESASAAFDSDLFDLSPPKQLPPCRPSTAMGLLSVDSPVRLVPESPRSVRAPRDSIRSTTTREQPHANTAKSSVTTTTKIALKDTPSRATLHRRAQSKPNLRSHSPLVTSTVMSNTHHDNIDARSTTSFSKETSASPAANTVFPMTPVHKHSRSMHDLALYAQEQAQPSQNYLPMETRSPPQTIATTTTTTTRIPLRGATEEEDDVFSPERHSHSQTEILRIPHDFTTSQFQSHSRPLQADSEIVAVPFSTSASTSTSSDFLPSVPGTPISREAALAQIRARRDRARSVNLKRSLAGTGPSMASAAGPKSPSKASRPVVVNAREGLMGNGARNLREISQASAPGRFGV